jgi:hypothetical protein
MGKMEVLRIGAQNARLIDEIGRDNPTKGMALYRAVRRFARSGAEPPPEEVSPETWAEMKEEQETIGELTDRNRENGGSGGRPKHDPDFESFWGLYPRQEKKLDAQKAWQETSTERPPLADILAALRRARQIWKEEQTEGRYIPLASSWLRGCQWTDKK